jgi:hypothetical protein
MLKIKQYIISLHPAKQWLIYFGYFFIAFIIISWLFNFMFEIYLVGIIALVCATYLVLGNILKSKSKLILSMSIFTFIIVSFTVILVIDTPNEIFDLTFFIVLYLSFLVALIFDIRKYLKLGKQ